MDASSFDRLSRTLGVAGSRRLALGALIATAGAALGLAGTDRAAAQGGCKDNGQRCTAGPQCCSGRCVRERGTNKKFCRKAPGQGICTVEHDSCAGDSTPCNEPGVGDCVCWVTTRGYSFCGGSPNACFDCETNADCEKRPGGRRGDRCAVCEGCLSTPVGVDRACVAKCPTPA